MKTPFHSAVSLLVFLLNIITVYALAPGGLKIRIPRTGWSISVSFCWIPWLSVLFLLLLQAINPKEIGTALAGDNNLRPAFVLVTYLSLAYLAVSCEITGFYGWLALNVARRTREKPLLLLAASFGLSGLVSAATSADVSLVALTPVMVYTAAAANLDPMALAATHMGAASLSGMLVSVSGASNIIASHAFQLSFMRFLVWMALPALAAAGVVFGLLYVLVHRRRLAAGWCDGSGHSAFPFPDPGILLHDQVGASFSSATLCVCLLALAVAPSLRWRSWLVAAVFATVAAAYNLMVLAGPLRGAVGRRSAYERRRRLQAELAQQGLRPAVSDEDLADLLLSAAAHREASFTRLAAATANRVAAAHSHGHGQGHGCGPTFAPQPSLAVGAGVGAAALGSIGRRPSSGGLGLGPGHSSSGFPAAASGSGNLSLSLASFASFGGAGGSGHGGSPVRQWFSQRWSSIRGWAAPAAAFSSELVEAAADAGANLGVLGGYGTAAASGAPAGARPRAEASIANGSSSHSGRWPSVGDAKAGPGSAPAPGRASVPGAESGIASGAGMRVELYQLLTHGTAAAPDSPEWWAAAALSAQELLRQQQQQQHAVQPGPLGADEPLGPVASSLSGSAVGGAGPAAAREARGFGNVLSLSPLPPLCPVTAPGIRPPRECNHDGEWDIAGRSPGGAFLGFPEPLPDVGCATVGGRPAAAGTAPCGGGALPSGGSDGGGSGGDAASAGGTLTAGSTSAAAAAGVMRLPGWDGHLASAAVCVGAAGAAAAGVAPAAAVVAPPPPPPQAAAQARDPAHAAVYAWGTDSGPTSPASIAFAGQYGAVRHPAVVADSGNRDRGLASYVPVQPAAPAAARLTSDAISTHFPRRSDVDQPQPQPQPSQQQHPRQQHPRQQHPRQQHGPHQRPPQHNGGGAAPGLKHRLLAGIGALRSAGTGTGAAVAVAAEADDPRDTRGSDDSGTGVGSQNTGGTGSRGGGRWKAPCGGADGGPFDRDAAAACDRSCPAVRRQEASHHNDGGGDDSYDGSDDRALLRTALLPTGTAASAAADPGEAPAGAGTAGLPYTLSLPRFPSPTECPVSPVCGTSAAGGDGDGATDGDADSQGTPPRRRQTLPSASGFEGLFGCWRQDTQDTVGELTALLPAARLGGGSDDPRHLVLPPVAMVPLPPLPEAAAPTAAAAAAVANANAFRTPSPALDCAAVHQKPGGRAGACASAPAPADAAAAAATCRRASHSPFAVSAAVGFIAEDARGGGGGSGIGRCDSLGSVSGCGQHRPRPPSLGLLLFGPSEATFSGTFLALPWANALLLLGMFVLVEALQVHGWIDTLVSFLNAIAGDKGDSTGAVQSGAAATTAAAGGSGSRAAAVASAVFALGWLSVGLSVGMTGQAATLLLARALQRPEFLAGSVAFPAARRGAQLALVVAANMAPALSLSGSLTALRWGLGMRHLGVRMRCCQHLVSGLVPAALAGVAAALVVLWAQCVAWEEW